MDSLKDYSKFIARFSVIRTSLRVRVALGVAFPVLLMMAGLSFFHYWRELDILEEQIRLSAVQLGDVLNSSISHAMVIKNDGHLLTSFSDVSQMENVRRVEIVGISGKVLVSSRSMPDLSPISFEDPECWNCHQYALSDRPRAIEMESQPNVLRVSAPISSSEKCRECHDGNDHHLGVLLIDMSLEDVRSHLKEDLRLDLAITVTATIIITLGMIHLLNNLVVRRIEKFREPIAAFTAGDYSIRLEKSSKIEDEIDQLVQTFNGMADEIDRYTQKMTTLSIVRQQAINEERERIARELHDGIAQVLGYVGTKVMAVRVNIQKGNLTEADRQLTQLEQAARQVSMDVREGILGLKISSQVDNDLLKSLNDYIQHFNNLSDVNVELRHRHGININLMPEEVFHLMRITQEALTNSRKHGHSSQVYVSLERKNGMLYLEIVDDGYGFRVQKALEESQGHFGLSTMCERAQNIGAEMDIQSELGVGTRVVVRMNLEGERS